MLAAARGERAPTFVIDDGSNRGRLRSASPVDRRMDNPVNNVTPATGGNGPSRTTAATGRVAWVCALTALTVVLSTPPWVQAQEISGALTLEEARSLARASSPEITAATAAVEAAAGRERQAGAFPNPVLEIGRAHV